MNRYTTGKIFAFIFLLAIMASCQSISKTSLRNLVSLYQPENLFMNLDAAVYHNSDSASVLFVKVNFGELLYQKDPYTGMYTSAYRLSYKLTSGYESGEVIETSTLISGDSLNYGKNTGITHTFNLKTIPGKTYLAEVSLFDFNRQVALTRFLTIDRTVVQGRNDFMVIGRNGELVFKHYLDENEEVKIVNNRNGLDSLFVSIYLRDFPVARPPYLEDREAFFRFAPDSMFTLAMHNGETGWIRIDEPCFLHFRADTLERDGLTLFRFDEGYPELFTAAQLRHPLRYITTRKEYDSLMANPNPKAAVDEFWLNTARTPERAKILIQKYYSNVEAANRFFTSYVEGWKSDRGLIYIVFGEPDYVYRADSSEEWIYGEPQNRNSLRFTFVKVNNPFTDNDYMLLRTSTLKEPWFVTVQSWRR
jgi:GWxTD domain-containing protein